MIGSHFVNEVSLCLIEHVKRLDLAYSVRLDKTTPSGMRKIAQTGGSTPNARIRRVWYRKKRCAHRPILAAMHVLKNAQNTALSALATRAQPVRVMTGQSQTEGWTIISIR